MLLTPQKLPLLIEVIQQSIADNAEAVTALDQAIGDGDHVINLQRGIKALVAQSDELSALDWSAAFKKVGMILLTTMGGASGSLFGTLFLSMSKATVSETMNLAQFADIFSAGVEAVKQRGKAEAGEKTMLDVLIPAADSLQQSAKKVLTTEQALAALVSVTIIGVESTRDMLATKGRASFLGERSLGHIDAGAKTSQLMICAIVEMLGKERVGKCR